MLAVNKNETEDQLLERALNEELEKHKTHRFKINGPQTFIVRTRSNEKRFQWRSKQFKGDEVYTPLSVYTGAQKGLILCMKPQAVVDFKHLEVPLEGCDNKLIDADGVTIRGWFDSVMDKIDDEVSERIEELNRESQQRVALERAARLADPDFGSW